ncbi:hypothetical protein ACQEV2_36140 [Streptomyces sp. CA-251387]|uniref:hypothetical protein n=1 Tax=Streptomyces sp. CA-251387 TaxID=3240064 RepID=UPI003D912D6D
MDDEVFEIDVPHDPAERTVTVDITRAPQGVRFVYPCCFGTVRSVSANDQELTVTGRTCGYPPGHGGSG